MTRRVGCLRQAGATLLFGAFIIATIVFSLINQGAERRANLHVGFVGGRWSIGNVNQLFAELRFVQTGIVEHVVVQHLQENIAMEIAFAHGDDLVDTEVASCSDKSFWANNLRMVVYLSSIKEDPWFRKGIYGRGASYKEMKILSRSIATIDHREYKLCQRRFGVSIDTIDDGEGSNGYERSLADDVVSSYQNSLTKLNASIDANYDQCQNPDNKIYPIKSIMAFVFGCALGAVGVWHLYYKTTNCKSAIITILLIVVGLLGSAGGTVGALNSFWLDDASAFLMFPHGLGIGV